VPVAPLRALTLALVAVLLLLALAAAGAAAGPLNDPAASTPDEALLITAAAAPSDLTPDAAVLAQDGPGYLSAVTAAARPFTHMLLRWEASVPAGSALLVEVRASLDGAAWTAWGAVGVNDDLHVPEDGDEVFWSEELYAGEGARFWQVRATPVAAPDGALPELRTISVNTVDGRYGPPDPVADSGGPEASPSQIARPAVVSRSAWGSPDGQGSRATPAYRAANHIVVHHTADANSLASGQRWSDRVRAIWSFHTITRGWGDIGYNYLIDPSGTIYEGRAGGDNAVGFHDTANYGSMGVSMIGTYASTLPTAAAQGSLVELLAWKTDQKDIDPLGKSFYYGCSISAYCAPFNPGAIVPNIAGHREVTPGHTTCPGDALAGLLPQIRERVRDRLGGGSGAPGDNGDLVVDERESGFERSSTSWYEWPCGFDGRTLYTFGTDNPAESANRAVWRPNLPEAGRYQVFVSVPRGCGLGQATAHAVYKVGTAEGVREVVVDQGSADEWVSLGSFSFAAGRQGSVELSDLTGDTLISQRLVFFDSVRWVKDDPTAARAELVNVAYDRTSVPAGELLKVTFTVRNTGPVAVEGQAPEATRDPVTGAYNLADSYVYDEGECFLGAEGQSYPAYPKELGRLRLTLGPTESARQPACAGGSGGYPWRWGINGRLGPGETREVVGYLRLRTPGTITLRAGAVNEYVGYLADGLGTQTITVTPERQPPAAAAYDELLRPLAHVHRLGAVPDNFLARVLDGAAVQRAAYAGSFAWQGETRDWGDGGPLESVPDLTDRFVVEQTRAFVAPAAGEYTFQVTADDGGWLWVDGRQVVGGGRLPDSSTLTGTMTLTAGRHVLSFRAIERAGGAAMGYAVRIPGAGTFAPVADGLAGVDGSAPSVRFGATFRSFSGITIAADDMGGAGVTAVRYSIDGGPWSESTGATARLGALPDGAYSVRYVAVDGAGNQSEERSLSFRVDSTLQVSTTYLPLTTR
jgi:hypothetical protein